MSLNNYSSSKGWLLSNRGFTLAELLITVVISSFIIAAIYSAYRVNQRHYAAQSQVVEMQQNIRAAMHIIQQEIRMAGYDPLGSANAGIIKATAGRLNFTRDIDGTDTDGDGVTDDGDGDVTDANENITIGFATADDATKDGTADSGAASLGISYDDGLTFNSIADNIASIEFYYSLEGAGGVITQTTSPTAAEFDQIRSVTVSILARAGNADGEFTNTTTYTLRSGTSWIAPGDNFRRRLLTTDINCRNMGLL